MSAKIIDGKTIAQQIKSDVATKVASFKNQGLRAPCLAVILVGDDPASQIYVSHKERACAKAGILSQTHRLESTVPMKDLEALISRLNHDDQIDGILLQLPLPRHLCPLTAISLMAPEKDVDGLTPVNQGRLAWRKPLLVPCTPKGILELVMSTKVDIEGKLAGIVGRSVLVGNPAAQALSNAGATILVMNEKTIQIEKLASQADILVVATGVKGLVGPSWVKPGAIVIDVGIHRCKNGALTGDVRFDEVKAVAGSITPVPGGVGPMTIAMLITNLLATYESKLL